MTLNSVGIVALAAVIGLGFVLNPSPLAAQTSPTILFSPEGTPGQFSYGFLDPTASDGGWVAIDFHRDPECPAISGFNLLEFVDFPSAFACPLTVAKKEWWADVDLAAAGGPWQSPPWLPGFRTPSQVRWLGNGAVPIYFVDVLELLDAVGDGVVTVAELRGLPSLRIGHATNYLFIQHNSSRSNSHPTMRDGQTQTVAHGVLEDGRSFQFNRNTHGPAVTSLTIAFK